jgi:phosphoribosylformylglycinamidine synthase subunit PurQ / glutaminase
MRDSGRRGGVKAGILTFPGSNCDHDLVTALTEDFGIETELLWHTSAFELKHDMYFVPGGFSYGDYLRTGALAAQSKSMDSLRVAAASGRLIVGICNGFQILCEARLLPGALVRNENLQHICEWTGLSGSGAWEGLFPQGYALPISHGEGNYICSESDLQEIKDNGQALIRYTENPNGSVFDIAGLASRNKRVIGLMPHPERALRKQKDAAISTRQYGRVFFDKVFSHASI